MANVRFVFETIGTRGDVAPLLAVGRQMVQRGYDASLLAPSAFAAEAESQGVDFVPTTHQHLNRPGGPARFEDYYFPAFEPVVDYFDAAARRAQPLVVVNIDKTATSNMLCERDGLPGVRLHLAPFKIRSLVAPPWPYAARARGIRGAAYLRHDLPRFFEACDRHPGLLAHINERRRSLALGPASSATPVEPHLCRQAAFFPEWFCPPASDWPDMQVLGFPLPPPATSLSDRVRSFLAAGSSPLVFTAGTGVSDVEEFFRNGRDCCSRLGRRGVFSSPHQADRPERSDLLQVDYAELGLLLPHAALLVHHGGIGTVARAIEAGIPQIVSPLTYDQPDNARRVERLGLGALLERANLNGDSLAAQAEELLGDGGSRQRLAAAKERVLAQNGIVECADLLEKVATSAFAVSAERRAGGMR